jgi:hypothetical protein
LFLACFVIPGAIKKLMFEMLMLAKFLSYTRNCSDGQDIKAS